MNVWDEEYWLSCKDFPQYKISSFGRIWDNNFDEEIIQKFNKEVGAMYAILKSSPYEFRGATWQMMFATLFQSGWGPDISVAYRDDDPRNLSMFNLLFYKNDIPLMFRLNYETGLWYRFRKEARKVRVIETGEVFNTVQALAKSLPNGSSNIIYLCLRGMQKTHKGLHYEWAED